MFAKKQVFMIDGSVLAYRSHFAFIRNPLRNSKGLNTSASYGFVTTLLRIMEQFEPELLLVAFDTGKPTFRHEQYSEYKATREKMPDEMRAQIPVIRELVEAFKIPFIALDGFEADDVLGTYAKQGAELGWQVTLVTADKDLMQLVTEQIQFFNPWAGGDAPNPLGIREVKRKMGVEPERIVDLLALMGDKSDNIPGVPSIGEKTAKKLLDQFGTLTELLARAEEVKAKRTRINLMEHKDQAELSRKLVTICCDVPVPQRLEALTMGPPDTVKLSQLFQDLEFRDLHKRFSSSLESVKHEYVIVDSEKQLKGLIKTLKAADHFVFDLETTSLNPFDAQIVGFAFCCEEGKAFYVPVLTNSDPNLGAAASLFDEALAKNQRTIDLIKPLLEDPECRKGGQNLKYDIAVCRTHNIEVRGFAFDTMLESYVLDPGARGRGLDDLALRYLSYRKIKTKELIGSGRRQQSMAELPVEKVAQYAAEDADITFRLHQLFREKLARNEALQKVYETIEKPLVNVLLNMERVGIKVDTTVLKGLSVEFDAKARKLLSRAHELAGESFNLKSPKQLRKVLYDKLEIHKLAKVRPKKTSKGELSTDVSVLERMADKHPLPGIILDYRSFTKLQGTYVDSLPKLIQQQTGRIHTSFNQAIAATGRLSSSEPNLQNIPIRSNDGMKIRSAFVAGREGWSLLSADYSQVELRLLAHLSGEQALIEAFKRGADIHRATAASIFEIEPEDVAPQQRSQAKAINFGIVYGMGAPRLARQTGLSVKDAQQFIDHYFERYPGVRQYLDRQIKFAEEHGYVETIMGRRRELPEIKTVDQQRRANAERIAINTPIQGSAADLIKLAMIKIAAKLEQQPDLGTMLLQVHDELVFECPRENLESLSALVRREMEGVLALKVPFLVEVGFGASWLEAH